MSGTRAELDFLAQRARDRELAAHPPCIDVRELEFEMTRLEVDAGPLRGRLVALCEKARVYPGSRAVRALPTLDGDARANQVDPGAGGSIA